MNILCKLGFHKPAMGVYLRVKRIKGKHKWHRNYVICSRCGKAIYSFAVNRKRRADNE